MGWELRWALRTFAPILLVSVVGGLYAGRPIEANALWGTQCFTINPARKPLEQAHIANLDGGRRDADGDWAERFRDGDRISDVEVAPPPPTGVTLFVADVDEFYEAGAELSEDHPGRHGLERAEGLRTPGLIAEAPGTAPMQLRIDMIRWKINGRQFVWEDPEGHVPMSILADCSDT